MWFMTAESPPHEAHRPDRRTVLLDLAIAHLARAGIGDTSLRELAAAIGTSHRMLIHYFGSKDGLWLEIVRAVEARQREVMAHMVLGGTAPSAEQLRAWWKHISDPSLWPNARLFFELYARGLQGARPAADILDGVVEDWVAPAAQASIAAGVPPDLARAQARLGVAVIRGLLLDLLATQDTTGVDAAMDAFIDLYDTWARQHTSEAAT